MHVTNNSRRPRSRWLMGLTVCGALLGSAMAAQAAEQQIGTVLGVPQWELTAFQQANADPGVDRQGHALPANSVTVLHVAPEFNSQIITVSVRREDTGGPATTIYLPTYGNRTVSRDYGLINAWDSYGAPLLIGDDHTAVIKVDVLQTATGVYTPGQTRFLMVPAALLGEIQPLNREGNLRIVHRQRAQIGGGDRDVVLMAVEPTGNLASANATVQVPKTVYPVNVARLIQSLNSNVSILNVDVSATGSTTLEVK